jgi:hypothetical protein
LDIWLSDKIIVIQKEDSDIYRMFGSKNQYILDKVMYHEFIPQIWWNELISHIIIKHKSI